MIQIQYLKELFDRLLEHLNKYNEYNLNEEEIIKKLIKFLILQKKFINQVFSPLGLIQKLL